MPKVRTKHRKPYQGHKKALFDYYLGTSGKKKPPINRNPTLLVELNKIPEEVIKGLNEKPEWLSRIDDIRSRTSPTRGQRLQKLLETKSLTGAAIIRDNRNLNRIDRQNDLVLLQETAAQRAKVCLIHLDTNAPSTTEGAIRKRLQNKSEAPTEENLDEQILNIKPEELDTALGHFGKIVGLKVRPAKASEKITLVISNGPSVQRPLSLEEFLDDLSNSEDPHQYWQKIKPIYTNLKPHSLLKGVVDDKGNISFDKIVEWIDTEGNLQKMQNSFSEENYLSLLILLIRQLTDKNINTFKAIVKEIKKLQSSATPA